MKGVCESCGIKDVEVTLAKSASGNDKNLCNQCIPADGAYAY